MAEEFKTSEFDIQLKIEGDGVRPDTISIADLAYILDNFSRAIQACAAESKTFDAAHISLADVKEGSGRYPITANPSGRKHATEIIWALESRDGSKIPQRARGYLEKIHARTKPKEWTLGVSAVAANGEIVSASIPPHIKKLFDDTLIFGASAIVATIMKAGGDTGNRMAELRLLDGTKLTAIVSSQELTQKIGELLYEQVELCGKAAWDAETWQLRRFKVDSLGDYMLKDSDPSAAVDKLRELTSDTWDKIDVAAFLGHDDED